MSTDPQTETSPEIHDVPATPLASSAPSMSSVYATSPTPPVSPAYSTFVPMVILVIGLIGWSGYQAWAAYAEGSELKKEFADAQPTIHAAEAAQSRLYSLAQDLVHTSEKDTFAAQIVKENNIQLKPKSDASNAGR